MSLSVLLVCLLSVPLAAPAVAQSDDGDPPTLAGAERGSDTTIVVTVADDTDVDEGSISLSDFGVSTGLLSNATVNESGANATVRLTLANAVNADNVTVSLEGSISDVAGNTVSSGSVTATGMDGQNPRLEAFGVERLNGTHGRITVDASERLSALTLAIGGANVDNLVVEDFTETSSPGGTVRYARVHAFPEEGVVGLLLMDLADEAGNRVSYNTQREYLVDRTPPSANLTGPSYVTTGDTHTFRSGAADNVGVESVAWSLGNGTTAAGRSITHTFIHPGNRTVTVNVTDGRGRTATVSHNVTVVSGASKTGVDVTPVGPNRTNASVSRDRPSQRVRIANDEGVLVDADGVTVASITATPPDNESLRLSVTVSGEARAFTTATGRRSIGSFGISHPSGDTARNVTFAVAVDRVELTAAGLAPEAVSLYRLNGTWTELPTRPVWADAETIRFRAESPGLSEFAVGASGAGDATNESDANGTDTNETTETATPVPETPTPTQSAALVLTNAALADESVTAGSFAVVTATVANRGATTGSRTLALTLDDVTVAERTVTVPPGENRTVQFATRVERGGTLAVDGTTAGTVSVEPAGENGGGEATETTTATPAPTATQPPAATTTVTNESGGLPNPLSFWPDGLVGTVLAGLLGLVAVVFGVLKALAIYLGY